MLKPVIRATALALALMAAACTTKREAGAQPLFEWGPGTLCVSTGLFQLHAEMDGFEGWHEQLFSASNTEDGVQLQPQGWAITFKAAMAPGRSASIAWRVAP